MSTAGEIIDQALKDVGVIGAGEAADGSDTVDALTTLNQLIAEWQVLPGLLPAAPDTLAPAVDLATAFNLPPIYDSALRYSLAERLLTTYALPPRQDIVRLAMAARTNLKRSNLVIPDAEMPGALQFGRRLGTCCGDE